MTNIIKKYNYEKKMELLSIRNANLVLFLIYNGINFKNKKIK